MQDGVDESHFHYLFTPGGFNIRTAGTDKGPDGESQEEENFGGDDKTKVGLQPGDDGRWTMDGGFSIVHGLTSMVRRPVCPGIQRQQDEQRQQQSAEIILQHSQRGQYPEDVPPEQQAQCACQGVAAVGQGREKPVGQREGQQAEQGNDQVPGEEVEHKQLLAVSY